MQFISDKYRSFILQRLAEVFGIILFGLSIFLFGILFSYSPLDPSFNNITDQEPLNIFGITGASIADLSIQIFGSASYLFLFFLLTWAYRLIIFKKLPFFAINFFSAIISILILDLNFLIYEINVFHGFISSYFFINLNESLILNNNYFIIISPSIIISLSIILFFIFFFVSCALTFNDWKKAVFKIWHVLRIIFENIYYICNKIIFGRVSTNLKGNKVIVEEKIEPKIDFDLIKNESVSNFINNDVISTEISQKKMSFKEDDSYVPPIIDILSAPKMTSGSLVTKEEMDNNASKLQEILSDFKIDGEIINVSPGPVVTMYELQPAPGTKASKIVGLSDDIARNMSAVSARVAVIPGKNVIGIEMPNKTQEAVYLSELFKKDRFLSSDANLLLALGKDIAGKAFFADLATMPHLLIAGTTGSGKSVGINVMILSILYRLSPEECKFILIDPKMLELSVYEGVPHLITPVVTNPKKAITALKWVVREMESRYQKMSLLGVRNIESYNQRIREALKNKENITRKMPAGLNPDTGQPKYKTVEIELNKMPFIVVVVDEMADLMMVAGKEIEHTIQRLSQMARAAGIHLIMATQRPSVDVITGTIKANFPTRISFQVSSKFDSRTILGTEGSERLLGKGDMLLMMGGGRTTRIHGPFVSDKEVEQIVVSLKTQGLPEFNEDILKEEDENETVLNSDEIGKDELFQQCLDIISREGKASTSLLQRKLQIGYNRAARIMDQLEENGFISAANHVGKREVFYDKFKN
ncbi:DNA translocase FtsK 4TM domain-containing protein [Pelagibacteraceae bacterium]|nr:DNA translocase FtsK 4TM domain-containing protein [Pelagibacteraceae bacterium]